MAHHAVDIGRPDRCIDLAEAAWRHADGSVEDRTMALFALAVARAHATVGDAAVAGRRILRGEQLLDVESAEESPWWAALRGNPQALLHSHTAKTLAAVGDHRGAEQHFARTVTGGGPGSHSRVRALTLHQFGRAQAAQGHLDQACATWRTAAEPLKATPAATELKARRLLPSVGHPTNHCFEDAMPLAYQMRSVTSRIRREI